MIMKKKTGKKKLGSEDEWSSENEDYEENYEDEGDYESEVDESEVVDMNRREQGYEQLLHDFEVESGHRLLWEGHSDIAQQWWEYENGKGAEMSLSQDEVYLVDNLRAIQEEVIEASEEENDPKYEGDEGSSDGNYSFSSQWETSDDDESQIEVVISSGSTSLTTPEEETLTEEWKVNKSLADQVKQEDAMMDEFIKWPENEQEETSEPQAIGIGAEGIGIEKDEQALAFAGKTRRFENEFFFYNHPTLNDHIAARELNLREAVYWVDFCGYPLIANDPNELLILQNQMQDEVQQSEARQLMTLQTGIDPGYDRRLVDDNGVLISPVEIELD
ncbi:5080_t:CDS:2 [Dentiscutata heterogama]|uniref:5080_t:CDS:1 n=1 Tax=Dentiscutata heterogama TaxID=1316150 RepID=A0ACA9MK91_9GLOM|nr:5080_t:CDS:2 [Dentiscutata heterogama]